MHGVVIGPGCGSRRCTHCEHKRGVAEAAKLTPGQQEQVLAQLQEGAADDAVAGILRSREHPSAIGVSSALTPDFPADESLRALLALDSDIGIIVVDELLIRVNLPSARFRRKPPRVRIPVSGFPR